MKIAIRVKSNEEIIKLTELLDDIGYRFSPDISCKEHGLRLINRGYNKGSHCISIGYFSEMEIGHSNKEFYEQYGITIYEFEEGISLVRQKYNMLDVFKIC